MTAPLRVAIAGAGMISRHHLIGWRALAPQVEVVAICDPMVDRARARADEFGVPAVYQDRNHMLDEVRPAALDIASPRETHIAWALAAAARGIAVFCQKPMAPSLAEAVALVRDVGRRVPLVVHENWRFRPWYRTARRWLDSGAVGELHSCNIATVSSGLLADSTGLRPALERQPFMAGERRLMIAEVLIHHLDVARFLCGPLRVVAARAARTLTEVAGETQATILLETEEGMPVTVAGTMAAPGLPAGTGDRLELIGSRSTVLLESDTLRLLGPAPVEERYDLTVGYQGSFDAAIRHFVEGLTSGCGFETEASDNLETLCLMEHSYWAAGLHRTEGRA
jgi:predicted dehydrogenase